MLLGSFFTIFFLVLDSTKSMLTSANSTNTWTALSDLSRKNFNSEGERSTRYSKRITTGFKSLYPFLISIVAYLILLKKEGEKDSKKERKI